MYTHVILINQVLDRNMDLCWKSSPAWMCTENYLLSFFSRSCMLAFDERDLSAIFFLP